MYTKSPGYIDEGFIEKVLSFGRDFTETLKDMHKLGEVLTDITKFKSDRGEPHSGECKFSILHYGQNGRNGFKTQWITHDGHTNINTEILNGMNYEKDTSYERLSGTSKLYEIVFFAMGSSCVESISIACGNDAVPGGGHIQIHFSHMNAAYIRDHGSLDITNDWHNGCVHFHETSSHSGYINMYVNAAIFKCEQNDDQCIQSHLDLH